jgi:hypothetical protein
LLVKKYKDCDVFHCRVKLIDAIDQLVDITPLCPEFESQADFIYHRLCNRRVQFLSDFIVDTEKFQRMGGFDKFETGWGLDDLAWFKMAKRGVGYSSNIGLYYRVHSGNMSSSQRFVDRFEDIDYFINKTDELISHPDFIEQSIYPLHFFEKKLKDHRTSKYWYVFTQFISKNSTWFILKFYLQHKKKYNLKLSLVYRALLNKVTNA